MNIERVHEHATRIVREAGQLLRQGFRESKKIEQKSTAVDLVTQYDTQAEAFITGELSRLFPEHHLFGEEGEYDVEPDSGYSWYIDPLDGTNNFAHGLPIFTVSLALYHNQEPTLGIVYDPMRDECFHAIKDRGAYVTAGDSHHRLSVSRTDDLLASLLSTGFPYDRHNSEVDNVAQVTAFLKRAQGVRRMGSAALDLAYVAAGRLDGHWEYKLNSWDVAAGILLVQEAGGRVSTTEGHAAHISYQKKINLVGSNGQIHRAMLEVLRSAGHPAPLGVGNQ